MSIKGYIDFKNPTPIQLDYMRTYEYVYNQYLNNAKCEILWDNSNLKIVQGIRRSGKTRLLAAYAFLNSIFTYDAMIYIGSPNGKMCKLIMDEVKKLIVNMPESLKPKILEWNEFNIRFKNNYTNIYSYPISKNALCGLSPNIVLLDEISIVPQLTMKETWDSLLPSIYSHKYSKNKPIKCIVTSTRRNRSKKDFFWNMWLEAQSGKSDFKPFKLSSKDCPHLTKEELSNFKKTMSRATYDREFTIRSK